ncbi:hypothetical protein BJ322DRAFT_1219409 [Thelephora terrestris]|uniref:F-box domain-containing protein n=1 Tax=Thelephora terrestris TaxID=56493 RepID=A0A9P6HBV9_9AGAM|nr:hypothetical protein BJ322DRAFT_1219409 [Thelephora terrestris]
MSLTRRAPASLLQRTVSMPHPIIEISELAQVIFDHCLLLRDERSLISLACTCRALEEQALSTLWSEQSSLVTLIESALPPGILTSSKPLPQPTSAHWDKFRRYASWMRRLVLTWKSGIPGEVFHLISLSLSDGVACPGLRELCWKANLNTLPFHRLFLSPKLTTLSLTYSSLSAESSERDLLILRPVIMGLDTFPLQHLHLQWWIPGEVGRQMESAASSAILRCGPALETLAVFSPVSAEAIQYVMQLPNLITWYTSNGPPNTLTLPLSEVFPQLDLLELVLEVSFEWLTFFTKTSCPISSGQNSRLPLNRGPIQRLGGLVTYPKVAIDAAFMSPIMLFRDLVFLRLTSACCPVLGCAFSLTDDDIAEIATALPRLGEAVLGIVCSVNSCQTTVASLVSLSTRCRDLELLEIHFNTANLRIDLESVSADPRLDTLPSLRTRDIFHLSLSNAPYAIKEDDAVPVLRGFRRIFPSLTEISGNTTPWKELSLRLSEG